MNVFAVVRRIVAAVLVALILAVPAVAQVSTFDLSGTALDQSSAVLPGATVSLKNTKTGLSRTETTDERGRYHFIALPVVGEYSVKIELTGFGAEERAGLVFQANTKPVIDFTLKVATLAEATTVVASAPILETRKSELSLTVDQKKIETMPLNGRNYLDLANFANSVHGAATRGDLSINGQLGRNIDYVVDGVSNKVIEWGDSAEARRLIVEAIARAKNSGRTRAGCSSSASLGRRCSAASSTILIATRSSTGATSPACTSPATGPAGTTTGISGSWAAWTT